MKTGCTILSKCTKKNEKNGGNEAHSIQTSSSSTLEQTHLQNRDRKLDINSNECMKKKANDMSSWNPEKTSSINNRKGFVQRNNEEGNNYELITGMGN